MSCIQVKSLSNLRGLDRLLTPTVYQETLLARFLFPAMRPGSLFGSYSYRIRSGAYLATCRDEGYDTKTIDSKSDLQQVVGRSVARRGGAAMARLWQAAATPRMAARPPARRERPRRPGSVLRPLERAPAIPCGPRLDPESLGCSECRFTIDCLGKAEDWRSLGESNPCYRRERAVS